MELYGLNVVDALIMLITAASMIMGLVRGLVKEALAVGGWLISSWVTVVFGDEVVHYLSQFIGNRYLLISFSYGGLFILVLLISSIINLVLSSVIKFAGFGIVDDILGLVFGFARAVLLIAIISILVQLLGFSTSSWWQESQYIDYFSPVAKWILQFIPDNIQNFSFNANTYDLNKVFNKNFY